MPRVVYHKFSTFDFSRGRVVSWKIHEYLNTREACESRLVLETCIHYSNNTVFYLTWVTNSRYKSGLHTHKTRTKLKMLTAKTNITLTRIFQFGFTTSILFIYFCFIEHIYAYTYTHFFVVYGWFIMFGINFYGCR